MNLGVKCGAVNILKAFPILFKRLLNVEEMLLQYPIRRVTNTQQTENIDTESNGRKEEFSKPYRLLSGLKQVLFEAGWLVSTSEQRAWKLALASQQH